MSSDQSGGLKPINKKKRIMMDSDEEERIQQEKLLRQQEKEKKRIEKQTKQRQLEEKRKQQKQQEIDRKRKELEMMDFSILLEQDSNSHSSFTKIRAQIKSKYPKMIDSFAEKTSEKKPKKQQKHQKDRTGQRQKSPQRQKDRERDRERQRQRQRQRNRQQTKPKISQAKLSKKEQIVYQLLKRWWYVNDKWVPEGINYEQLLSEKGYILLSENDYRKSSQIVNGKHKVKGIFNFPGVFRTKGAIIDLRPKDNVPSVENYSKKQLPQLMSMLRTALRNQIKDLQQSLNEAPYKNKDELSLLENLKQQLLTIQK